MRAFSQTSSPPAEADRRGSTAARERQPKNERQLIYYIQYWKSALESHFLGPAKSIENNRKQVDRAAQNGPGRSGSVVLGGSFALQGPLVAVLTYRHISIDAGSIPDVFLAEPRHYSRKDPHLALRHEGSRQDGSKNLSNVTKRVQRTRFICSLCCKCATRKNGYF